MVKYIYIRNSRNILTKKWRVYVEYVVLDVASFSFSLRAWSAFITRVCLKYANQLSKNLVNRDTKCQVLNYVVNKQIIQLHFRLSPQYEWDFHSSVMLCSRNCYLITWYVTFLSTAIGLTPGGSSTVHFYTKTIHGTTQITTEQHK